MTFKGLTTGGAPSGPGPVPRTPIGLSGLGAVGGPRGVGAGALRILVEFLTQYDASAVQQLQGDLDKLELRQKRLSGTLGDQNRQLSAQQSVVTRINNVKSQFTTAELKSIKSINDLQKQGTKDSLNQAAVQIQAFRKVAESRGISKSDTTLLINGEKNLTAAAARTLAIKQRINSTEEKLKQTTQTQVITEKQLTAFQEVRAKFLPKLLGLGLGAVGGIFGGAVLGVGFAAAQAGLEAIGNLIQDLIDPSRHAREELSGVAESIRKIQDEQNISTLQATKQLIQDLGPLGEGLQATLLKNASALDKVNAQIDEANKLLDVQNHLSQLTEDAVNKRTEALLKESIEREKARRDAAIANGDLLQYFQTIDFAKLKQEAHAKALEEVTQALDNAALSANKLASAQQLEAQSAAFAAIQQRTLASIIQNASDLRTGAIQDQLDALSEVGPSARTTALEDELNRIQDSASGVADALKNINEQRALLLFQRRLLTEDINPASVTGEFRLAAIDARIKKLQAAKAAEQAETQAIDDQIAALQKAGDEQDRFNQLLDIQFKLSQPARRQQGESISDFITRRAQETRDLLAQQAKLGLDDKIGVLQAEKEKLQAVIDRHNAERDAAIKALQEERERVDIDVQLHKLAEQEKDTLAAAGRAARIKELQKELEASKANDQKTLESKRRVLQDQLKNEQRFWADVQTYANTARIQELSAAISFSKTMQDLLSISGEVAGAKFAANQLRALLASGLIPPAQQPAVYAILKAMEQLAASYNYQLGKVLGTHVAGGGTQTTGGATEGFASGGVVPLKNSTNMFGSNIRYGEQGTELGVILSNRVSKQIQDSMRPSGPLVGSITFQSSDPLRDRYELRRLVREEMARAIG